MTHRTPLSATLVAFALLSPAFARNAATAPNVNSRYKVETVELSPGDRQRLSAPLRARIQRLAGQYFDPAVFDDLASRIRGELRNRVVTMRLAKGAAPEQVKVVFETKPKKGQVEVFVPRFVYSSKNNFTFGADTNLRAGRNTVQFGVRTDNDELPERYSGVRAGYYRDLTTSGRVSAGVDIASWRAQWNPASETAHPDSGLPGIYRTRFQFHPSAKFVLTRDLTLQLGVSLDRLELQSPAARSELSSAAVSTLRFQRRWESAPRLRHGVEARYGLRTAPALLGGDFIHTRHDWSARYGLKVDDSEFLASLDAGLLLGRAPLSQRFILGNSTTLRGWNRFDLAPLGGDRMVHGSLEYRHRWLRAIYDTGSVWNRGSSPRQRHSVAFGVASGHLMGLTFLVAFPLREGRVEPIFLTGINF